MKFYNQRTFGYIIRSIQNANDLIEKEKYKSARLELKEAIKLLEKDKEPSRLLAICYKMEGEIFAKMGQKNQAMHAWLKARSEFERVQDESDDYKDVLSHIQSGV